MNGPFGVFMISIFNYIDYRVFMRDYYLDVKQTKHFFSYRYIAQHVGFKSPGLFYQIIKGKTNLSTHLIKKFSQFFKLTDRESKYFELIVLHNRAKSDHEKNALLNTIMSFKEISKKVLTSEQLIIYKKWYYLAITKVLSCYEFKGDFKELARIMYPPITPEQAQEAIDVLLDIQLLRINDKGVYECLFSHVSPGKLSGTATGPILGFNLQMFDLVKESLENLPEEERMAKGYFFVGSAETYKFVCDEIKGFYQNLYKKVKVFQQGDLNKTKKVYGFKSAIYPLSNNIPLAHTDDNSD